MTWMLRPSAEDVTIVQHGGSWAGQHSGFVMVPERNFVMTVLTNSQGGSHLHSDLFADDWALRRFAGVSNTPAVPQPLETADLAPYAGRYVIDDIAVSGIHGRTIIELRAGDGQLDGTVFTVDTDGRPDEKSRTRIGLVFYRHDYGLDLGPDGKPLHTRSDFVRGPDGRIVWFRSNGRLFRRQ
ncbi:hypothetical protein MMOR_61000 [Mycolicibacterium moriokaense]|uniref:Beta-lactamase-related domain-containing protein n=1 Tax=Mycolicibacterium moriokaense TaxID=39691 RepID=A0AAD1MA88_9MYCO|nr:hypothetical protein MMOR_61000 [Mycolicibacterium moriokaense]